MEQYHPDAHVGKPRRSTGKRPDFNMTEPGGGLVSDLTAATIRYEDINRSVSQREISTVRRAAESIGLWRFCDPVAHDGFNI